MKKILMSIAIAASAMCLHGASFSWGAANIYAGDAKADGVNGYLLFANVLSVEDATAALKAGNASAIKEKALQTTTVNGGSVLTKNTTFDYADGVAGESYDAYFVVFNNDDSSYFMSGIKASPKAQETSTVAISFGNMASATQGVAWTDVGGSGDDPGPGGPDDPGPDNPPTPGPGGDGDVPEPTSGLLLMIGGAALALRRRR